MADVPRDPRQLARDILSGKVRIEDLAREQARRGVPGARPAGPGQQKLPAQIPLPRPAPPPQQRRGPVIVPVRPPARTPPPAQRGGKRPPPAKMPAPARPAMPVAPPAAARASLPPQPPAVAVRETRPAPLRKLVGSREALRRAIIMAEVLGPPVGLRE